MKSIRLSELMVCPEAWHRLLGRSRLQGDEVVVEDSDAAEALAWCPESLRFEDAAALAPIEYRATLSAPAAPRQSWPLWAKALALLSKPEDRGLGDVIARTIGPIGGDAFKAWHRKTFGRDCGCEARQEALNLQYRF